MFSPEKFCVTFFHNDTSCLTVLSGPADTIGVPGEHCGQCRFIQCLQCGQQENYNYSRSFLSFLHSQCQDIGRPACQENNPRRAVAQVLSLPLSMSPGKLWVQISVVKMSHVYVVQANTVSQGVPWFVKLSTFRPIILVFLRSPDAYLVSRRLLVSSLTTFGHSDFYWIQTFNFQADNTGFPGSPDVFRALQRSLAWASMRKAWEQLRAT